jgi:hypothetical protein
MILGVLVAQAASKDHTPDVIIWSIATTLLLIAFVLGLKKPAVGRSAGWRIAIAAELALCVYAIIDVLKHLHSI